MLAARQTDENLRIHGVQSGIRDNRVVWRVGDAVGARSGQLFGGGCVRKTRNRRAVRKMKEDPSEPPCRRRLQTALSCFGPKAAVVNVRVKRRDIRSRHVWIREMSANARLTKRRKDVDDTERSVCPLC